MASTSNAAIVRKLRKACSLPSCSQKPGECMHCTCDGRCGKHVAGLCGLRREGNERSCKQPDCPKDESCRHSTRATCCHCRNLVSSKGKRSRDELNASSSVASSMGSNMNMAMNSGMNNLSVNLHLPMGLPTDSPLKKAKLDMVNGQMVPPTMNPAVGPSSSNSNYGLEPIMTSPPMHGTNNHVGMTRTSPVDATQFHFQNVNSHPAPHHQAAASGQAHGHGHHPHDEALSVFLAEANLVDLTAPSLCEYFEWSSRENLCNLIVVVEGTQFNLHKYPMLMESRLLNQKAREYLSTTSEQANVPVVTLPRFPGGAETFETLCIYAYTGDILLTANNFANVFYASNFLQMGNELKSLLSNFLGDFLYSNKPNELVDVISLLHELHQEFCLVACEETLVKCITVFVDVYPLQLETMMRILNLTSECFLQLTQLLLARRSEDVVNNLCVQAQLAQLHGENVDLQTKAQQCLALLHEARFGSNTSSSSSTTTSLTSASEPTSAAQPNVPHHGNDMDAFVQWNSNELQLDQQTMNFSAENREASLSMSPAFAV